MCCRCNLPINRKHTRAPYSSSVSRSHRAGSTSTQYITEDLGSSHSDSGSSNLTNLVPDKKSNWRTLIVNCHSLNANKASLHPAVEYIKPDCIIGTESWLNPGISDSEVMPPDFTAFRKDRSDSYGGSFIAINKSYNASLIQSEGTNSEIVWAEVQLEQSTNLLIGSYYRAPSSSIDSIHELEESLSKLPPRTVSKNIILGGDFNAPDVNWDIPSVNPGTKNKTLQEQLITVTTQHELHQIQDKPTRGENILDLLFTNNPSLIKYTDVVPGISDHEIVIIDQDIKPAYNKKPRRKVYRFKQANWDAIRSDADKLAKDITSNINKNSVDANWTTLKKGLTRIMDRHIPSKLTSARSNLPWFGRSLKKKIKKKHKLYQKARSSKSAHAWDKYRQHKRETQKALRSAELNYVKNMLEESLQNNNTKPFWKFIKSRQKDNIGVSPIKSKGKLYSDSKSKAELLNNQFESVFTNETIDDIPTLQGEKQPSAKPIQIEVNGVEKLLKNIKTNKASGPDNIPNQLLKETASEIAPALAAIFKQSLDSGTLPDDWLTANIAPVFKKGNRHEAVNYRPVSLTCVCCKLLEHIVCRHILCHLEEFSILSALQHGFRKGLSCVTQLLLTLHDITSIHDRKLQVDMAILDFSKAFDTVPHQRLLSKLDHYGIRDNTLNWINSFLTQRTQRVTIEGTTSESVHVKSGVPQGTVLGPLLFLCFINDLPDQVRSQVRLFADDCLLYRPIKNDSDQLALQQDLDNLQEWANKWGMVFNPKKCYILRIARGKSSMDRFYHLDGQILSQVHENPYLGLMISEDLKWSKHITKTCQKATSVLAFLRRNLKQCPRPLKNTAYKSMVRSIMEYSCEIWDPYLQKDIQSLEKVQRRCARFVTNDYSRESSVTAMMNDLEWPLLEHRRKNIRLTLLFKLVNGLVAIPPDDLLTPNVGRTRSASNLDYKQYRCNTNIHMNSFVPRTIKDWNSLPADIKRADSIDKFKQLIA